MTIQINTDKNIEGSARLESYTKETIKEELSRFSDHITRVEVHLSDENAGKTGKDDKRCMLEVRLKNKQPLAVTSHADKLEKAVSDALNKAKKSIGTTYSKLEKK